MQASNNKSLPIALSFIIITLTGLAAVLSGVEGTFFTFTLMLIFSFLVTRLIIFLHDDFQRFGFNPKRLVYRHDFSDLTTLRIFLIGASSIFFMDIKTPDEPIIAKAQTELRDYGLVVLLVVYALKAKYERFTVGSFSSIAPFIFPITVYGCILWLLGNGAEAIYEAALKNPDDTLIVAILSIGIFLIYNVTPGIYSEYGSVGSTYGMARLSPVAQKLTEQDLLAVAAHESGHALTYAAFGGIPDNSEVVIRGDDEATGIGGYVTTILSKHTISNRAYEEWEMLTCLAGKAGEYHLLGSNTLGAVNDHQKWTNVAKEYLSNHNEGIFYNRPKTRLEQETNDKALVELQKKQRALLDQYFDMNSGIHQQLADALMESRRLEKKDLVPYLSQVTFPDGFPLPLGMFEQFSEEWDSDCGYF